MPIQRRIRVEDAQIPQDAVGAGNRTYDGAAARYVQKNRSTARSDELIEAIRRLDTTTDPATAEAIMAWIRDEYAQRQGGTLVGLFARCYLGPPYVDHRLDLGATCILEHYSPADSPPAPFVPARPLARNSAYLFIEVYDDGQVVPIRPDGSPIN